jgi:hypothetical protein
MGPATSVSAARRTNEASRTGALTSAPLRDRERERLELHHEVHVLDRHMPRHLETDRREVQDPLDPRTHRTVRDLLSGLRRHRQDHELDAERADERFELLGRADP